MSTRASRSTRPSSVTGQQIKRRVARAWLTQDGSGGWVPRRGRVADGYFDERRAHVAAAELVKSFVKDFNESERVERERRTRGVTFRELAHGYLEWLEKVRGAKPSTIRSHESDLAEPGHHTSGARAPRRGSSWSRSVISRRRRSPPPRSRRSCGRSPPPACRPAA